MAPRRYAAARPSPADVRVQPLEHALWSHAALQALVATVSLATLAFAVLPLMMSGISPRGFLGTEGGSLALFGVALSGFGTLLRRRGRMMKAASQTGDDLGLRAGETLEPSSAPSSPVSTPRTDGSSARLAPGYSDVGRSPAV